MYNDRLSDRHDVIHSRKIALAFFLAKMQFIIKERKLVSIYCIIRMVTAWPTSRGC